MPQPVSGSGNVQTSQVTGEAELITAQDLGLANQGLTLIMHVYECACKTSGRAGHRRQ